MIHHLITKIIFLGFTYCPFADNLVNEVIKAQVELPTKTTYEISYEDVPVWWEGFLSGQTVNLLHLRRAIPEYPKRTITIYVSKGLYLDTRPYISGLTYGLCFRDTRHPVSFAGVVNINPEGLDRTYPSAVAIAHELAHQLSCTHRAGTLMDPDAARISTLQTLTYGKACKRQIRRCLA